MYVILGNQIRDYLDEYDVKETYCLTRTKVNTRATKAAALSNLVKIQALATANIDVSVYQTACDVVLNLYFGAGIIVRGRDNTEIILEEVVRYTYAKNSKKEEEQCKRRSFSDAYLKQKMNCITL
jgi:hypothetical protein